MRVFGGETTQDGVGCCNGTHEDRSWDGKNHFSGFNVPCCLNSSTNQRRIFQRLYRPLGNVAIAVWSWEILCSASHEMNCVFFFLLFLFLDLRFSLESKSRIHDVQKEEDLRLWIR